MTRKPHPRNAPGDYYVEHQCCTLCGVPWNIAPELFAYDDSHCWVARQPVNQAEEEKMLEVISTQELGCIRYRGAQRSILETLAKRDEERQSDHPVSGSAPVVRRTTDQGRMIRRRNSKEAT